MGFNLTAAERISINGLVVNMFLNFISREIGSRKASKGAKGLLVRFISRRDRRGAKASFARGVEKMKNEIEMKMKMIETTQITIHHKSRITNQSIQITINTNHPKSQNKNRNGCILFQATHSLNLFM